jgi:hypothetical protein
VLNDVLRVRQSASAERPVWSQVAVRLRKAFASAGVTVYDDLALSARRLKRERRRGDASLHDNFPELCEAGKIKLVELLAQLSDTYADDLSMGRHGEMQALEMRRHVARYLAGQDTLDDLEEWFAPAGWEAEDAGDPIAADLAESLLLLLSEFARGHWSETDFKGHLRPLLQNQSVVVASEPPGWRASSPGAVTLHLEAAA